MALATLIAEKNNLYSITLGDFPLLNKACLEPLRIPNIQLMQDLVDVLNDVQPTALINIDYESLPVEYSLVCMIDDMLVGMEWLTTDWMFEGLFADDKILQVRGLNKSELFRPVLKWLETMSLDVDGGLDSAKLPEKFLGEYNALTLTQKAAFNYLWHNTDSSAILPLLVVQERCTIPVFIDALEQVLTHDKGKKWEPEAKAKFQNHINNVINWINRLR